MGGFSIAELGRYAIARSNIAVVLNDLSAIKARIAETAACDEEWQVYVDGVFEEIESLLGEALEDLK